MSSFRPKFGYIPPEERSYTVAKRVDEIMSALPVMAAAGHHIAGSGAGKVCTPYLFVRQLAGFDPMDRQGIGDCVSHGWAGACQVSYACDILERGEPEEWLALIATEWIYGTSRFLVGGGRLGNRDGSIGVWAARAVVRHGLLWRLKYDGADLRRYSGRRAKDWGYKGLPLELEEIADQTPVSAEPALVTTYEQARDAIANGNGVAVCSTQGFDNKRDRDGYLRASGRWNHCMRFTGSDDTRRPGLFCDNSWGPDYFRGPVKLDAPRSGGWVDADRCDQMLRQGDSFAVPGIDGFKKRGGNWAPW